jgi:hypothetical protein
MIQGVSVPYLKRGYLPSSGSDSGAPATPLLPVAVVQSKVHIKGGSGVSLARSQGPRPFILPTAFSTGLFQPPVEVARSRAEGLLVAGCSNLALTSLTLLPLPAQWRHLQGVLSQSSTQRP